MEKHLYVFLLLVLFMGVNLNVSYAEEITSNLAQNSLECSQSTSEDNCSYLDIEYNDRHYVNPGDLVDDDNVKIVAKSDIN